MSSSIDADTEQVAQVAQALNNTSLESPSQVRAAADAVPMSASTFDRVMGDDGKIRIHAQQFPGPTNLDANRTRVRILVERQVDGKWETKNIKVEDLAAYESDG
ncbi:hypothetical protein LZL87_006290 [Fusarium oxysporum]|uniref:Uncharacterized protein n=1 Tax=Fusarium oxysporum f. sp. rapae TaxID=485398 RepID=A0A8J5NK92_FUSOX|nr:hypothetical protein Forpe1208_v014980 [Fusarium oxysporum f. sp. rapae]KAI7763908.1 hypothetical protein LZL87_006290 [Fusarium oxysporum]